MEENFAESGHTLQGPHLFAGRETPLGFAPLCLEVQATGQRLALTRPEIVFGRHTGSDVRLGYPEVSRRHCRFTFKDGWWRVFDLNSLNGVFVNGERIVESVLYESDLLAVGNLILVVQAGAGVMPAARKGKLQSIAEVLPIKRRAG